MDSKHQAMHLEGELDVAVGPGGSVSVIHRMLRLTRSVTHGVLRSIGAQQYFSWYHSTVAVNFGGKP